MSAFLELFVDKLLKAVGYSERVDRAPAATHSLTGGIVDVDDIDLFHEIYD